MLEGQNTRDLINATSKTPQKPYRRGVEHETAVSLIRAGIAPTPGETWAELGAGSGVFTAALSALLGPRRDGLRERPQPSGGGEVAGRLKTSGATLHVQRADFTRPLAT